MDALKYSVEVEQPDDDGCYEWMSIRAGQPSKFCADVTFTKDIIYRGEVLEPGGGGGGGLPCNVFAIREQSSTQSNRQETSNTNAGIQPIQYTWQTAGTAIPLNAFANYVYNAGEPDQFRQSLVTITKTGTYRIDMTCFWRHNRTYTPSVGPTPGPGTFANTQSIVSHACAKVSGGPPVLLTGTGQANAQFNGPGGADLNYSSAASCIINVGVADLPYEIFLGEIRQGYDTADPSHPAFEIGGGSNFMLTRICETPYPEGAPI
jgi:hypothetical protein